ncbi:MAG TPA: family 20 glycosylhydrolase [Acidobacteriaceae bacterium]|nr:family 20 glycosylhydrolase [Acidobacteriaceae bacterium]
MAQDSHAFVNTLMPEPAHLSVESGYLPLTTSFTAATDSFRNARLDNAIHRVLLEFEYNTGLQIARTPSEAKAATLMITVGGPGEAIQGLNENESYTLDVTPTGAHLKAATVVGAMEGMQTFLQLVQTDGSSYFVPSVSIQDSPRFRWRGLMIDCSRHFEPISVIKRTLDGMAAVKLNVFHWHLSDDQGFRIQSKVFPKLTEMGSDGKFYTQAQAREIVAYARARGIRVVPEFDIPGHSQSWFVGYPNLASGPGPYKVERQYGIFDPVMDPTRQSTYVFLNKFIGEMATIFPDAYMHIGGDENNGVQWKNNPRIQRFMKAHNLHGTKGLQTYFNQKLMPILKKHDKHMVGWDEIFAPGLSKDAVIESWRGFDSLAASAKQGYDGILAAGYYLDQIQSSEQHYLVDPIPVGSDLTPAEKAHILGGEAAMWGEAISPRSIDSRIWPRTAAIAERLWSPQSVNNVDDMYRRLWVENLRLESLGLTQISYEDVALRQLAGTANIGPLRTLASVLQPVGFDQRYHLQHTSQLTPMDHLIDAVPPDPPSRHGMEVLVRNYLANHDAKDGARLQRIFGHWIAAGPKALAIMQKAPRLNAAEPRATELVELGTMGQQALHYIANHQTAPAGWAQAKLAQIKKAETPDGKVRFTVLGPMRKLVNAAQ